MNNLTNGQETKIPYSKKEYGILVSETIFSILLLVFIILAVAFSFFIYQGEDEQYIYYSELYLYLTIGCAIVASVISIVTLVLTILATIKMCQYSQLQFKTIYDANGKVKETIEEYHSPLLVYGILNLFFGFIITLIVLGMIKRNY